MQTFDQYSQFLRAAVADEESLQLGESLQGMAAPIETLVGLLRQPDPDANAVAQHLLGLMEVARQHGALVQALGGDWHRFYEFNAHAKTLAHFRTRVALWAREAAESHQRLPVLSEFELAAWRVLGAGALLLDVYEQSAQRAQDAAASRSPFVWRLRRAWRRFLTVLHWGP
ncbi:hypothetical protein RS694_17105 [Rhodoferax saidenbachensis]|uniref:Uncharacterized protein n=1 Tax=Rhodoferax saidenbachensis TaxID=1484693 RepID=A0A1P8KDJ7_9BURK|nr:hypothetical protein RS694_17105 [Rhodoferax saidenbachensis]